MSTALTQVTSSLPARTTAASGAAAVGAGGILLGFAGLQVALAAGAPLGNLASSSGVERWAFGPAAAVAFALTAFLALRTRWAGVFAVPIAVARG
jgi:hypothetical protein